MTPGFPDLFDDGWNTPQDTPAHQLAALGLAAVPALIGALDDARLARVYGGGPDSADTAPIWSVGDCALMVLSRIAGRDFWQAGDAEAAKQMEAVQSRRKRKRNPRPADAAAATERAAAAWRAAAHAAHHRVVQAWWNSVQNRGETEMLAAGVRSGNNDSVEQARLLVARDPAAAIEAAQAGLRAKGASDFTQTELVDIIAETRTDAARAILRRLLHDGPALHVRVAAGTALFQQGEQDVIPVLIDEWKRWQPPVIGKDYFDRSNDPEPLVHFLGSCGNLLAMQALADRYASLPLDVKQNLLATVTDTNIYPPPVRGEGTPQPPEVSALGEALAASALDDPGVSYGATGGRSGEHEQSSWLDPRVCDCAGDDLAQAWPERYVFQWAATRQERDQFIAQERNVWRAAHGQPGLPLPERPPVDLARSPNEITVCRWVGGDPLPSFPLATGKALTTAAAVDAFIRLHRDLPAKFGGFSLTVERAGDGRGFAVEIAWRLDRRPVHVKDWDFNDSISRGDLNLHNRAGGEDLAMVKQASNYADERFALENALKAPPDQSVVIHYNSRLRDD